MPPGRGFLLAFMASEKGIRGRLKQKTEADGRKNEGRLGKRCVDVACGGWAESLWSKDMTGTCVEGIQKGRMAHGRHGIHGWVLGLVGFFGI